MDTNSYFTVELLTAGTLGLQQPGGKGTSVTVYYWINKDPNSSRDNYDGSITTSSTLQTIPNLVLGDKVKFYRAETTGWSEDKDNGWNNRFNGTAQYKFSGNIASLIGFSETLPTYCFENIFYNCSVVDAGELDLPWTTLSQYCFGRMFINCTKLTEPPVLPATSLAAFCYYVMFRNCIKLEKISDIKCETINSNTAFYCMYQLCSNLTKVHIKKFHFTNGGGFWGVFWASGLIEATVDVYNDEEIPAKAYSQLFTGCTNLSKVTCNATNFNSSAFNQWLNNVSSTGTFIKDKDTTWRTGTSGIPSGWTIKNVAQNTQSIDLSNVKRVIYKGTKYIKYIYAPNNILLWTKKDEPISTDYLTLQALEDGKFSFNIAYNAGSYISELSKTIYYSKNNSAWTSITFSASYENSYIDVVAGDKIRLKGTNSRYALNSESANNNHDYIIGTGSFRVYGNIMSLINGDDFVGTSFNNNNTYAFTGLFWGLHNSQYVSKLTSVSEIYLPEAIQGTYWLLFAHCHYLEQAPVQELSISLLSGLSHNHEMSAMFINTAIQTAPTLPSLTVYESSYTQMFEGCTELVNAQSILPATTLSPYCYSKMFNRCSKLVTAPVLPATTLVTWCYTNMFLNCTALRYIKALFTTTPSNSYTSSWVSGCSNTSDFIFVKNSAATWTTTGDNAVLSNWTIQYEAA